MSLQKQLEYNKGLFMYRVFSNEAPRYISNLYTHTPSRYSNSRNYHLSLPRPRIDIFKTSISFPGVYMWNNLPLTVRSCQSSALSIVNFVHTLKQLHRMDCDIILCPILPTACDSAPLTVLYKISIDCFSFFSFFFLCFFSSFFLLFFFLFSPIPVLN